MALRVVDGVVVDVDVDVLVEVELVDVVDDDVELLEVGTIVLVFVVALLDVVGVVEVEVLVDVDADRFVLVVGALVVDVELFGGLEPVVVGGEPAATEDVVGDFVPLEPISDVMLEETACVWKLSTAMSPMIVATMMIGARFMARPRIRGRPT